MKPSEKKTTALFKCREGEIVAVTAFAKENETFCKGCAVGTVRICFNNCHYIFILINRSFSSLVLRLRHLTSNVLTERHFSGHRWNLN